MSKKIGTTVMLLLATLQVACGKSKKDKAIDAYLQQACGTVGKPCVDMYKNAANNTAIAGLANTTGLPQVAAAGTTPTQGQVPGPEVLPASVSNAQVAATTAKIQSQIQALNAQEIASSTSSSIAPASVSPSAPEQVEVGITRLQSVPVSAPALANPISLPPSMAAAPVTPPEQESGAGAGH